MPTSYTTNYGLNQWEPEDKVLRTDFNDDNAKIDAAFFNHPSAELIASATVTEESTSINFDISQVDWSRYLMLTLLAESENSTGYRVEFSSGNEVCANISARHNEVSSDNALANFSSAFHMGMLILVFYDGGHPPVSIGTGYGRRSSPYSDYDTVISGGGGNSPLEQCKMVRIYRRNGNFQPGDRACLWGLK